MINKFDQKLLLNIAMWNIEGLISLKINDSHFLQVISNFPILGLVEDVNACTNLPGFDLIVAKTRKKNKKARRNSGGVRIYAKTSVSKGISKLATKHSDIHIVWTKLEHKFFNLPKDIYLAFVYISPESAAHSADDIQSMYTHLLEGIVKYSKLGDILIQGDFNAYTNTMPDFIVNDEKSHSNNDVFYKFDNSLPRNNLDSKRVNNSGKHFLNMCKESGLRILNGRTTCDLFGRPTCITYNGCSLVDYSIVSNELLSSVGFFKVHEFTVLSNQCPIVCGILSNIANNCIFSSKLDDLPSKYIWSDEAIELYKTNIQSKNIKDKFNNLIQKDFGEVNKMVGKFNSNLIETANMSTKFIKRGKPKRDKSNKTRKNTWFSESCEALRISVNNFEKLVNKFPFNAEYRKSFYTFRSCFRRRCKYEEKQYKEKICNKLDNCVESNPKVFWKLINKLDQSSTCKINESLPYNSFKEHFEEL
ncbi:unnamed protein product [Mytilus coruscus]|uniref:Endonuclease/exonuclease/phosphatase domain-containing protein n=1 Tax=Mytilus coruscus TaxID=42192 RepID=A0A6J8AXY4_MYTCO|nr:unnamed protein product [Mytilus coruscus]